MQTDPATQQDDRHFAFELIGLIARIIATAIAINVVLGGFVLMLAGQAHAAATLTPTVEAAGASHEMRLARPTRAAQVDPLFIVLHRHSQPVCDRATATNEPQEH